MQTNISAEQLRQHIAAIEQLTEERAGIAEDIRERFSALKAEGFDLSTVRRILKLRKMDEAARQEASMLLETYGDAIGLQGAFLL